MAVEKKRGCGYRKIGGKYLISGGEGWACGRFPIEIVPCPLCDHRPPFQRGIQRITPKNFLHAAAICKDSYAERCAVCPLRLAMEVETAGLMWVGAQHYTPEEFIREANAEGISKRIPSVPRWLKVKETWVFLAHEHTFGDVCVKCNGTGQVSSPGGGFLIDCETCNGEGMLYRPGVFYAFQPVRVEQIIPDTMPVEERAKLEAQGLTLVEVPHDDPDHAGRGGKGREAEDE